MKFNKIDWRASKLSPDFISDNIQQKLRLYIADTISQSDITSARVKISKDGRGTNANPNGTETVYLDWTELTVVDGFYEATITITETLSNREVTKAELKVEVTDSEGNIDYTNPLLVDLRGV